MSLEKLFVVMNCLAFLAMGYDKLQAKRGGRRISEATLLVLAALMGAAGSFLGMQLFRHKTKHAQFKYGVPLLLVFNLFAAYYLLK